MESISIISGENGSLDACGGSAQKTHKQIDGKGVAFGRDPTQKKRKRRGSGELKKVKWGGGKGHLGLKALEKNSLSRNRGKTWSGYKVKNTSKCLSTQGTGNAAAVLSNKKSGRKMEGRPTYIRDIACRKK